MNPPNPATSPAAGPSSADVGAQQSTSDQPAGTAREPAGKIRQRAKEAVSRAKDTMGRVILDQKDAAADRVGGYSSAMRESARSLETEDPNVAHFANQAADRIEQAADYIRNADFASLRRDAEGVARRHPALFVGGMLLAGLVLGNLAKASGQELSEDNRADTDNDDDSADTGYGIGAADEPAEEFDEPRSGSFTSEGFSSGSAATGF